MHFNIQIPRITELPLHFLYKIASKNFTKEDTLSHWTYHTLPHTVPITVMYYIPRTH
jgi:hypothetical protein